MKNKTYLLMLFVLIFFSCGKKENKIQDEIFEEKDTLTSKSFEPYYARIKTFVDGVDVQHVNLWDSKTPKRKKVAFCVDTERVKVVEVDTIYAKVKKKNGKEGWCMHGFLEREKNKSRMYSSN